MIVSPPSKPIFCRNLLQFHVAETARVIRFGTSWREGDNSTLKKQDVSSLLIVVRSFGIVVHFSPPPTPHPPSPTHIFTKEGNTFSQNIHSVDTEVLYSARADNLARAMGLPECFSSKGGEGGGVIQGSASEGTLVALLAARTRALGHMRRSNPGVSDHELLSKMALYASDQVRFCTKLLPSYVRTLCSRRRLAVLLH